MKVDTTNPFMVQEWIRRGITKSRESVRTDFNEPKTAHLKEEAEKAVSSMERSLRSLDGVCILHVDQLHEAAAKKIPWWKFKERREFDQNANEWKHETRTRLAAEAAAIEKLEI